MNSWRDECVFLLENLGGHAYLKDIYEEFKVSHTREQTKQYKASIRDALEKGCRESEKFDGKELFYMVEGKNKGHYGLINYHKESLELTQDDDEFAEGKRLLKQHVVRERNPLLVAKAKSHFKQNHGDKLYCEACGFDFEKVYGELGEDFIEAHHTKPVSSMGENESTKIEDIVMLCSNCHSMVHRRKPWLTKNEITKLVKQF